MARYGNGSGKKQQPEQKKTNSSMLGIFRDIGCGVGKAVKEVFSDDLSPQKHPPLGGTLIKLEELQNQCNTLERSVNVALAGKDALKNGAPVPPEDLRIHERLSDALRSEKERQSSQQALRIWANDVYNAYYSSDGGIAMQISEFEEFMDTQLEEVETPELCCKLIRSNYIGNLAYTCSKLTPKPKPDDSRTEADEKPQEEQLSFLGWSPIKSELKSLSREIGEAFSDSKYEDEWIRAIKDYSGKVRALAGKYEANKQALRQWKPEPETAGGGYRSESELYENIRKLCDSEAFQRLKAPYRPGDSLEETLKDSREVLALAHSLFPGLSQ